ncbi:MAG: phosphotransferase [Alphaproteobacteria bacterium]|nr:phosphotransferase [Alphaproteobacteria bacterium]
MYQELAQRIFHNHGYGSSAEQAGRGNIHFIYKSEGGGAVVKIRGAHTSGPQKAPIRPADIAREIDHIRMVTDILADTDIKLPTILDFEIEESTPSWFMMSGLEPDYQFLVDQQSNLNWYNQTENLRALGKRIGILHSQMQAKLPPDSCSLKRMGVDFFPPYFRHKTGDRALALFDHITSTPRHFVHGDLSWGNIATNSQHGVFLIDWEYAHFGYPIFDVAVLVSGIDFYLGHNGETVSPLMNALLEGYANNVPYPAEQYNPLIRDLALAISGHSKASNR